MMMRQGSTFSRRLATAYGRRGAPVRQLSAMDPKAAMDSKAAGALKQAGNVVQHESATQVELKEEDDVKRRGAVGGFVRGLFGGHQVAAEDAYVAEAKKQGVEVPPPSSGRTDLVATKRRKRRSDVEDEEESIRDRLFSRFKGSPFMRSMFDAGERVSERIEESDNPVVNFFRNMFAENEMGAVIREIREDDPNFRVSDFLEECEHELLPHIIGSYLKGNLKALKEVVTDEALEMLSASIREWKATGTTMDTNILAINDVELTAGRLLEDAPVLIVSFSMQQINCLRNAVGDVVEGAEDDIRAVYYVMAFVREVEYEDDVPSGGGMGSDDGEKGAADGESTDEGEKEDDGEKKPKPWKMMEMVIRGAHSTI